LSGFWDGIFFLSEARGLLGKNEPHAAHVGQVLRARRLSIFPNCETCGPADGHYDQQIQQQNRTSGPEERAKPEDVHDDLDFM
jgi:hypothetical protein